MTPIGRLKAVAFATTAVGVSGVSLLAPVLPELAALYGVGPEAMAWFQTAVMLPGVASGILLMKLADRISLRSVLVGALVLYGLSGVSLLWQDDFTIVLVTRLFQGTGSGALVGASFAILRRLEGPQRARAIGHNAALVSFAMVLQPLLGSALASVWLRLPFAFYGLAGLVAIVAHRWAPAEVPVGAGRPSLPSHRRIALVAALASTVTLNAIFFGWLLYLTPIVLAQRFDVSVEVRGLVLAGQSVVAMLLTLATNPVRAAGRYRPLVLAGWAAAVVSFVVLSLLTSRVAAIGVFTIAGLYYGATNPSMVGVVSDMGRDALVGWWQSSARLGQVLGPLAAAALLQQVGESTVLLVGAGLALVGAALTLPLTARSSPGSPIDAGARLGRRDAA